jgi:NAD-dependent SIR2 family protein deacetylase
VENEIAIRQAAAWIRDADGRPITAGAGTAVDSGLPDFRGTEGLWRAYPALLRYGFSFEDIANPSGFASNSRLSRGFMEIASRSTKATFFHRDICAKPLPY